jgi:TP901 family phage tail tape measure protein
MAEDANANIRVDIDTTAALASIKNLQRQISAFHTNMAKGGAAAAATSLNLQQGLLNSINRTGQFSATIKNVKSTTESFTTALEKNKLSMREYFRYSGAATKTFGRLFTTEFDTINKVARERVKDLQTQYIKMGRDANGAIRAIAVRPLALDMENLSTKTQIAAQRQALLNQMLKQGSTNLLNFGKNTQWAGRQLMVGFTVPLTMFGTVAAKTFMDMEKQAIRFKRVYGEMFTTTEETNKALQEIKNLAAEFTKYGVAVEKTMELAADVAATGKMGAELTAQVANATRLAVLGGVEQSEALQATISLTDAFGTSAEQLAGKIDFLNAVENQTITSIEDLTIAIPKAGPVVQQLGGDVRDLTFFLTAMREGGINASEGANALKSGLASLINPTGKAAEMLQGFGINLKEIVDSNKGNVKGIVIDFAKALDTLDPLNRAQAIEQLFGKFQFARLSTLFQNVIKEGNQASRVLKLTNATTEELAILSERELKKVEESPMFKFQKAIEDLKVSLVPVGEAFLKAVTPVIEFGTKILEKFNDLDAGAKQFVVGLTAVAGVIGPVFLMGFGLIANGVANVIKMFTFFKTAMNKAGTASTQLGMQTDYMTQQQLEASAVAASLNQIHQTLTQTFTSEAAAINNLSVAYRKALAAQSGMAGGAIARTRTPKKYASGVVSVPGPKGAGDVVPAMLSPGEAVIPTKMAKKYGPLINGMISDNIPGFAIGKKTRSAHLSQPMAHTPEAYSQVEAAIPGFSKLPEEIRSLVEVLTDLTAEKTPALNTAAKGRGMGPEQFMEEWNKNPESLRDVQRRAEEAGEMIVDQANSSIVDGMDSQIGKRTTAKILTTKLDKTKDGWLDKLIAETTTEVIQEGLSSSDPKVRNVAGGLQARKNRVGTVRTRFTQLDASGKRITANDALQDLRNRGLATRKSRGIFATLPDGTASKLQLGRPSYNEGSSPEAKAAKRKQQIDFSAAIARGEEPNVTWRDTSASSGMFKNQPGGTYEAPETAKNKKARLAAAINEGKMDADAYKKSRSQSLSGSDPYLEATARRSPHKKAAKDGRDDARAYSQAKQKALKSAERQGLAAASNQALYGTTNFAPEMRQERKRQQAAKKAANAQAATQRKILATEKAAAAQAQKQAILSSQTAATATKKKGPRMGLGGMAMVASGAVMAGSMVPGQIGQISQQLMMPIMALSMILPMLTSKFAIIAAAVTGVVAAFVLLQMAIAGIRKESAEATRSLSSGKEAMSRFAETAGTVTGSEYMKKRRQQQVSPFVVETGKTTFGQSFVESEAGTALLTDFEKQVERFGKSKAIESLQKQLTTAVATGVLSTEQAQSIAQSLGQKLGDYGITANINASIQSIVGPDGEVLEGNTIKIYTEFIQSSTSGVTGTGGILQSEDLTGGAPLWWWDTEKVAKREGEAAGIIANFYDENQQLIDAFDAENLKNIDALFEQGKYEEALAAEDTYQKQRKDLIASYNQQIIQLQTDFAGVNLSKQKAILSQLADLAKASDAKVSTAADKLNSSAAVLGQNSFGQDITSPSSRGRGAVSTKEDRAKQEAFQQVKVQFLGELAAGNIETETFNNLMTMFDPTTGTGQATLSILAKISTEIGPQSLAQLENIFSALDNPELAANIAVKIQDIDNPEQLQNTILTLEKLSTFDGKGVEAKVVLQFFGENPEKLAALQEKFTQLSNMAEAGKLDIQTLVNQRIITTGDMEAFKADQAYFNSLDPEQQVRYVQVYLSKIETVAENEIDAWYKANPDTKKTRSQVATLLASTTAAQYVRANPIKDPTAEAKDVDQGGGGAPPQSVLDDIVKRLRDVRKNQIKVTNGWTESAKVLENLFGGGKTISIFGGIEQDMRRLGAGEDLITLIAGMDPKEFEKQKNKLFTFDKKTGEIIGFKRGLQNIGDALNSIAVGEFVNEQQKVAKEARNQVVAFGQLRAAGYSVEEAYQAIQDTAVATAVATGKMTKSEMNKMLADIKAAQKALKEAAMLTPEGMQEVFDEGFNKAMEAFEAEEKRLTLEFDVKVKADKALVSAAENEVAKIQYIIDDYEADLRGIEDQEEKINKTYDTKLESLEKVRVANQKILEQEKGKLSVAEAITRGDLYAAAQAAQQVRETSASGYFASQTSALESGRERALGQVRGAMGLSREQIQQKIKDLSDQIFFIEEKTLEPANERIRLAQVELDKQIQSITVLGRTKTEWETVKNGIDLAKVSSDGYVAAMQAALDIVTDLKNAWAGIESKEVTLTIKKVEEDGTGGGGGGGGGGSAIDYKNATTKDLVTLTKDKNTAVKASTEIAKRAGVTIGKTTADTADKKITAYVNKAVGNNVVGPPKGTSIRALMRAGGGLVNYMANGGSPKFIKPSWAKTMGTDRIPAMLTPGEFVINRPAVSKIGVQPLNSINNGEYPGGSVYNYNLSVNVSSMSDPNDIAQTVMAQIRRVESQRIRSNKF